MDQLHVEMRTGERLWWRLFSYPLDRRAADAALHLKRAVKFIREQTSFKSFKITYIKGSRKSLLNRPSFARTQTQALLDALVPVCKILVPESDAHYTHIVNACVAHAATIKLACKIPKDDDGNVIGADDNGYEDILAADAAEYQRHCDLCEGQRAPRVHV